MPPDEPQIAAATPPAPPSRPAPRRAPSGIDGQLRRAIEESGLSLRQLAADAGVSDAAVQRFVNGSRDLKLATAAAIAGVLGLKLVETGRPRRGR